MNSKSRFVFRGFHEDSSGSENIYINGQLIKGWWVKGNLRIVASKGEVTVYYIRNFGKKSRIWNVIPETIGSCTGMKAKRGIIFEGDICRFYGDDGEGEDFIVRWNDALCRFEVAWTENGATDDLDNFFAERAKVIGTVFDRKEGYDGIL
ncbi:MAG: hypothetical protein IJN80_05290 [Clostridia bacterium]|nr:hypothetical protein [Clostridia bacterium]